MKKPVLISDGQHGRRLRDIAQSELDDMVKAGTVEHIRGNLYRTKVMRAAVPEHLSGHELEVIEEQPAPTKRRPGRPRKADAEQ